MSLVTNGQAKQLIIKIDKKNRNSMYAYAPDSFYVFVSEPLNPALTIQGISAIDL